MNVKPINSTPEGEYKALSKREQGPAEEAHDQTPDEVIARPQCEHRKGSEGLMHCM